MREMGDEREEPHVPSSGTEELGREGASERVGRRREGEPRKRALMGVLGVGRWRLGGDSRGRVMYYVVV
jgi:hypothetical protein